MSTINKATTLQTQVLAANLSNEHSKEIILAELEQLKKFVGYSIFKVDGSLKEKYKHDLKSFDYKINQYGFDFWVRTNAYIKVSYSKIEIKIMTTVSGGGYDKNGVNANHSSMNRIFDLCNLDKDGKITDFVEFDFPSLEIVHDVDQILEAAKKVEEAKKVYEQAINGVNYIFRDALYIKSPR